MKKNTLGLVKVQVEKDIRDRVEKAAEMEGLTMSAWLRRTLLASLPPLAKDPVAEPGKVAMEAAFQALDENGGENDYPGVLPIPPMPWATQAPIAEAVVPPPSINTPETPSTGAAPFVGHSCAHLQPGPGGNFTQDQIQGTCAAQGGRVCHWASHVASNCAVFKPRRVFVPPMQSNNGRRY